VGAPRDDLAATRQIISAMVEREEGAVVVGSAERPLSEVAATLDRLVAARMCELEEKTQALEKANRELQRLNQNLDHIVRQRTRALAESESQLRRKNLELDRLNQLKSQFIAIAAHELSTPMTSIVGYVELFHERASRDLPPDLVRQLASLRRNAHRMKRLIEDILDVSRLESGAVALRRAPTALGEIALHASDELRPMADDKRLVLSAVIEEIPPIDADSDKIHQVVANLVVNSIKYTPPGGAIRLNVDRVPAGAGHPPRARLRVWDSGVGIPAALRQRIFEPFSDLVNGAAHHTSRGPDSAGLGLRIARGIVELHGGEIQVASEEGKFTELTVLLPFA
jgi:signal transduction histidine kinase